MSQNSPSYEIPGVVVGEGDMGAYGAVNLDGDAIRKRMRFVTNSRLLLQFITRLMDPSIPTVPVAGKHTKAS